MSRRHDAEAALSEGQKALYERAIGLFEGQDLNPNELASLLGCKVPSAHRAIRDLRLKSLIEVSKPRGFGFPAVYTKSKGVERPSYVHRINKGDAGSESYTPTPIPPQTDLHQAFFGGHHRSAA